MRRSAIRFWLGALALLAALAAAAAPTWQGHYLYEHDPGLTEGGPTTLVSYDLTLGPGGARGGCLLSVRGFQTDERILCQTRAEGATLTVSFHGYANGSVVNKYGIAVYKPGESLFTLSKSDDGGLLTRWGSLEPDGEGVAESGVFFLEMR